ncbi:hypothetical protein [Mucilaginibacter sp. UR6-11]|uniref:hypothetical protein n=1 Tax=Mucilaginibacter sp. UR6-11 TaxID=1435644 RepID=UPI001E5D54C6|nr:hypothetical protein [Mucilaginibacter sp. UR6-11]MCC8426611.1 hypothetical protein [Mucilaginibacter sp. UR6-11]
MFTNFNEAERAMRFPEDRRMFIGINRTAFILLLTMLIATAGVAWLQYLLFGLPTDPSLTLPVLTAADPKGFPLWLSLSHWINFFFLALIIRSGLSILADHPRLYWNRGCSPRSEWLRFTPVKVPDDRVYTAKEDGRYLNPVAGLPGYRHSIGIARSWHFITVPFFLLNGVVFIGFLFFTNQWKGWSRHPGRCYLIRGTSSFTMPPFTCLSNLTVFIILMHCSKFLTLRWFFFGACCHAQRYVDVPGHRKSFPSATQVIRQPPGRSLRSLFGHDRLLGLCHHSRGNGGCDRADEEYESYHSRYGQHC